MIGPISFRHNIILVGFGCIGKALLPLLFRHLNINPSQITVFDKCHDGIALTNEYQVLLNVENITPENYLSILEPSIKQGDLFINLSVDIASAALIELCQKKGALYLDTCTEPWKGEYKDASKHPEMRTNYALRQGVLNIKTTKIAPTAVITHGANPGLVSHFVKQALLNMAKDNNYSGSMPSTREDWGYLAHWLGIKSIHIAERDMQTSARVKKPGEFVNTWSVEGFISEGSQPAELGWGTHEKSLPDNGFPFSFGTQCAIYLKQPGAATKVRTWTPSYGASHGFLITHAESISIADYLTLEEGGRLFYRPTVHYAYVPCPDAILSIHELAENEWHSNQTQRIMLDEIIDGMDELGVLLMGNKKGAYWFGSQLSVQQARELAPGNNATSLQVVAGVLAGVMWAIENPNQGIVEPEDIQFDYALKVAIPYLGELKGHYTDWTPLRNREHLFSEQIDNSDPWQFKNMLVD
ncbi:homospermidine synthase [Legionella sp. W05-934-2]|jgi:homospermidine synthase|uniref:homospermidine synthase n=1 Tax=Legionella sp. W05-934-2 TaxID=1198649 RepID=UPI003462E969